MVPCVGHHFQARLEPGSEGLAPQIGSRAEITEQVAEKADAVKRD